MKNSLDCTLFRFFSSSKNKEVPTNVEYCIKFSNTLANA